ncbi:MAG: hypothetical protein PHI12_06615 [Dehalococcoidales bacterium]|nr:hypothetical protein [Dehalococcoidales bacterium]
MKIECIIQDGKIEVPESWIKKWKQETGEEPDRLIFDLSDANPKVPAGAFLSATRKTFPEIPLRFEKSDLAPGGILTRDKFEELTICEGKRQGYSKIYDFDYPDGLGVYYCAAKEGLPGDLLFFNPHLILDKEKDITGWV